MALVVFRREDEDEEREMVEAEVPTSKVPFLLHYFAIQFFFAAYRNFFNCVGEKLRITVNYSSRKIFEPRNRRIFMLMIFCSILEIILHEK